MKITTVLMVESIERSLPFWVDRMGFEKVAGVPGGDSLAFAILVSGGAELMLQTIDSVAKDMPSLAPKHEANGAMLFIEVDDFEDARKRLEGYPVTVPERVTFYGMREIGVTEPGGHVAVFAAKV